MLNYFFEQNIYTDVQQQMENCLIQLEREAAVKTLSQKCRQLNYSKTQLIGEVKLFIELYPIWTKRSGDAAKRLEKWRMQHKTADPTMKVKSTEHEIRRKIGGSDIFYKIMQCGNDFELSEVQKQFRQVANIREIKIAYLANLLHYAIGQVIQTDATTITVSSEFEWTPITITNERFFTQFHNDLIGNMREIKLNQKLLHTIYFTITFIKDEEFEVIRDSIALFSKEKLDFKGLIEVIGKELQNKKCILQ